MPHDDLREADHRKPLLEVTSNPRGGCMRVWKGVAASSDFLG